MKITGLKDMESYIYSKVILPLKELDVQGLAVETPMHDDKGTNYELLIVREETGHVRFAHNFQRNEAQANAKHLIILRYMHGSRVLADYDSRTHNVTVYEGAFEPSKGRLLMNKLVEAFNQYTPFTKVKVIKDIRDVYAPISMEEVSD